MRQDRFSSLMLGIIKSPNNSKGKIRNFSAYTFSRLQTTAGNLDGKPILELYISLHPVQIPGQTFHNFRASELTQSYVVQKRA